MVELGAVPAGVEEGGCRLNVCVGGAQHERAGRVEVPDSTTVTRCQRPPSHCDGLGTWQMRSEDVQQALLDWDRKYVSAVGSKTSFRMISPVNGKELKHEEWTFPDLVSFSYSDIPRVSSAPSLFPPNPIRQSIAGDAPVLYTIRAIQTYVPPAHDPYRGHPFFKLSKDDCFEVLEEYDHPAAHTDLPRRFMSKEGEDCLLKVRAKHDGVGYQAGAVGWALARFVSAD